MLAEAGERNKLERLCRYILEDLERYPDSSITEVLGRVGPEIPLRTSSRAL